MTNDVLAQALLEVRNELREIKAQLKTKEIPGGNAPDAALTTAEAARFCKVSQAAIRRWQKLGLPYIQAGKGFKFVQRDLVIWRDRNFGRTRELRRAV